MQIKNRQKFLTILTLSIIGLLVLDKVVTPPLTKLWKSRSAEIKALKREVDLGSRLQHRKESLRQDWANIKSSALTNDTSAAQQQLLTSLYRWAQISDIQLDNITPNWKQGADISYKILDCHVDASGSIDRLTRFMYELETDPMALKVQSVEMTSKDNNGSMIGLSVGISGLVLTGLEPKK